MQQCVQVALCPCALINPSTEISIKQVLHKHAKSTGCVYCKKRNVYEEVFIKVFTFH